jgi:UTP:GlnB (protein PII) uridylyltransferase
MRWFESVLANAEPKPFSQMSQIARTNARALPIGRARRLALAQMKQIATWINQIYLYQCCERDIEKYALIAIGGYGRSPN